MTPIHIKSEDAPAPPGFQAPVFTSNVATERKELGIAEALYYQMMGNESDVTMLFTAPVYDTETPEAPEDPIGKAVEALEQSQRDEEDHYMDRRRLACGFKRRNSSVQRTHSSYQGSGKESRRCKNGKSQRQVSISTLPVLNVHEFPDSSSGNVIESAKEAAKTTDNAGPVESNDGRAAQRSEGSQSREHFGSGQERSEHGQREGMELEATGSGCIRDHARVSGRSPEDRSSEMHSRQTRSVREESTISSTYGSCPLSPKRESPRNPWSYGRRDRS